MSNNRCMFAIKIIDMGTVTLTIEELKTILEFSRE